jgi:uncharacterized BrkB/YihY/UPF0761 family membrane protein
MQTAGGQRAAAISYRVLFSLIPRRSLVSVLELFLPEAAQHVVSAGWWASQRAGELAQSVDAAVKDAGPPASATGAHRTGGADLGGERDDGRCARFRRFSSAAYRPYLRGKLLDFVLVLGAGVLVVSAFGLSIVVQVVTETSSEIAEELGGSESASSGLSAVLQLGASLALALLAFGFLYRFVPPVAPTIQDVVPGAIVAAVGVHLASAGFSIYLSRFGGFNDVFGPLGAILAFLLLVYAVAAILLLGACIVAAWPQTAIEPESEESVSLRSRLVSAARGLVVRDRK